MTISRRMFFAAPSMAALRHARPGELIPVKKANKRLLVIFNPLHFQHENVEALASQLGEMGFEGPLIPTADYTTPDIRIFDLDNLPDAETGMIRELIAEALNKNERP